MYETTTIQHITDEAIKLNLIVSPEQKAEIQKIINTAKSGLGMTGKCEVYVNRLPTAEEDTIITTLLDFAEIRKESYLPWKDFKGGYSFIVTDFKIPKLLIYKGIQALPPK